MSPAAPRLLGFVDFCAKLGVKLTRPQAVFARVAFDGVQPGALTGAVDRALCRAIFGDLRTVRPGIGRVVCAVFGARAGKSYLSALRLLHLAITVDLTRLAPGEVAVGLIVAPDTRLSRQTARYVIGAVKASPVLARMLVGENADSLTIRRPDGRIVSIEALPATRGGSAVRGRSLVGAVLDEAAFFLSDDGYIVNDVEIYRAVMPRVVRGGQTLVVSTPWSRAGLLFELYRDNFGKPTTCLAARADTMTMRDGDPTVAAVVASESLRDPANAMREYGAHFTDTSASLLSSEDVEACVDRGVTSRPARPDVTYAVAVDVGLRNDSTVVSVAHVESRNRGPDAPPGRDLVVDAITILKPKASSRVTFDEVEEAVASNVTRYHAHEVRGDLHYSDALAPRLRARGIAYVEVPMSPSAQEGRAKTLAAMFSSRAVTLLDNPTLVSELKDLRVQRHAGGRVSVGASGSRHDDAADTLLLLAEASAGLPAVGGDAGVVEFIHDGVGWTEEGVESRNPRWVRALPNGRSELVEYPRWAAGWEDYAREQIALGCRTPEIMRWEAEQLQQGRGINVAIED